MGNKKIAAHKQVRTLTEVVNVPEHDDRTESPAFRASKKRLKADGHYQCYICDTTEDLQVHHYGGEWSLEEDLDMDLLKEFLEEWDVYGYGKLLKKIPVESTDDVRNMMVLCQEHHTGGTGDGSANGIHNISFSAWIAQKLAKKGRAPVPLEDPTLAKEEKKKTKKPKAKKKKKEDLYYVTINL